MKLHAVSRGCSPFVQAVAVRAAAEREAKAIMDTAELECESMRQAVADEVPTCDPFKTPLDFCIDFVFAAASVSVAEATDDKGHAAGEGHCTPTVARHDRC